MPDYIAKQPTVADLVQAIDELRTRIIRQYNGELSLADTDRQIIRVGGKTEAAEEIFSELYLQIDKIFQA